MNHLGMSYTEIRKLPITYRRWFIDRIIEDFNRKEEARKTARSESDSSRRVRDIHVSEQMVEQMREANKPVPKFSKEKKF